MELCSILDSEEAPAGRMPQPGTGRGAHLGFQAGSTLSPCFPASRRRPASTTCGSIPTTIHIPARLNEPRLQTAMAKVLVPPPVAKSDEILAESGGMFYSRETPEHESRS